MIIRSSKLKPQGDDTLFSVEQKKDLAIYSHVENVSELLAKNQKDRESRHNGFSADRSRRKIASFSTTGWLAAQKKYPGLVEKTGHVNQGILRKALSDPEFELYKTVGGRI